MYIGWSPISALFIGFLPSVYDVDGPVHSRCRGEHLRPTTYSSSYQPYRPHHGQGQCSRKFPKTVRFSHSSATSLPDLRSDPSWELGTVTEALLEYSWPQLSVFGNNTLPPARRLFISNRPNDVVQIATERVTSTTVTRITPDTHCSPGSLRISPAASCLWWRTDQSVIPQVCRSIAGFIEQSNNPRV